MSRVRKLLIVTVVLVVGLVLAWPFRKLTEKKNFDSVATAPSTTPPREHPQPEQLADNSRPKQIASPAPHVVAKMTSLGESIASGHSGRAIASFDLANHPALAGSPPPQQASPVTPPVPPQTHQPSVAGHLPAGTQSQAAAASPSTQSLARPAYSTVVGDHAYNSSRQNLLEIRHVVQNSDTLEKIAKRYLGDEGRALEIFDLNRDVLDNPHLLPIDAELRLPGDAQATLD